MDTILIDGTKYEPMVLDEVKDFEPKVIEHAKAILVVVANTFQRRN